MFFINIHVLLFQPPSEAWPIGDGMVIGQGGWEGDKNRTGDKNEKKKQAGDRQICDNPNLELEPLFGLISIIILIFNEIPHPVFLSFLSLARFLSLFPPHPRPIFIITVIILSPASKGIFFYNSLKGSTFVTSSAHSGNFDVDSNVIMPMRNIK